MKLKMILSVGTLFLFSDIFAADGATAPVLPSNKRRWVKVEGSPVDRSSLYCMMVEQIIPALAGWATGISASLMASGYLVGRDALMDPNHPYHATVGLSMVGVGIAGAVGAHSCCRNQKFGVWVEGDELRKHLKSIDEAEKLEEARVEEAGSK